MSSAKEEHGRRDKPGSRRRRARLAAVQALYQIELTGNPVPTTIAEFRRYRLSGDLDGVPMDDIDPELFAELATGVGQHRPELDRRIAGALTPDWPLERLDTVLRAILRAASYELLHCSETPAKVVISEYMALADSFFSGREPALVNGVLDTISRKAAASGAGTASP
jgi:transcription antitermination protein NusB